MSVISDLVSYMVRARYEDLPEPVIEVIKKSVLDTLATMIAGSSGDGLEPLVKLVKGWGGREECAIAVYGGKVPAPNAALVNCTMARACDLDDVHELSRMHVSATTVPSAFIVSEYSKMFKSKVINGKDFILAVALGSDLLCRMRMAGGKVAFESGWSSETFPPIPVAAMGAKMLGFGETKFLNAMGIGYAQCAGNIQAHIEGALAVRLQQGLAARAGILAIVLADQGLSGAKDILEGKYGFYSVYMRGEFIPEELAGELGERFEGNGVSIKAYSACKATHRAIYGALQLAKEHNIKADDVERVTISTNTLDFHLVGGESKIVPQTVPDAQFSLYYTVATALIKGKVFIDDFTEEAIKNAEVLAMARRVNIVVDPDKDKLPASSLLDIEIETKGDKHYKKTVETVRGNPDNPMTFAEVVQKLEDCARFSAKPLPSQNIDKISRMVGDLDKLDDVTVILECLA